MAEKVIADIVTHWKTEGADKAAASLEKAAAATAKADAAVSKYAADAEKAMAPATDAMVKSQDSFSRKTLATAKSIENLEKRIDPVYRALKDWETAQKKVNLAIQQGTVSQERGEKILAGYEAKYHATVASAGKMERALNDNSAAARLSSNQMLNLSRQTNDVITMFALGANPMQIFASQAGQVYDAISSEGGLAAGMKRLAGSGKAAVAAIASTIGVIPAVGLGLAAVGAAGYAAFELISKSAKSTDDILADFNARLKDIEKTSKATSEAVKKALNAPEDFSVLLAGFQQTKVELQAGLAREIDRTTALTQTFITKWSDLSPAVLKDQKAIRRLGDELRSHVITAEQFRQKIAEIRIDPSTPESIVKIADKLLDASKNARALEAALKSVDALQSRTIGKSDRPTTSNMEHNAARVGDLPEKLHQQARDFASSGPIAALNKAQHAMETAGLNGYAKSLADINAEIKEQIALNPENADTWRKVGEAEKQALAIQTRIALFQGQTDNLAMLKAEALAIGRSKGYYDDLMTTIQAKIDLERQGISVTSKAGQAYIENARKLGAFNAAIERQKDAWSEVQDAGSNAIDDLVDGLTDGGTKISDVFKNVARDIERTFIKLTVTDPIRVDGHATFDDILSARRTAA